MIHRIPILILILLCGLAAVPAWSQDDVLMLKSDEFGEHRRAPVPFTHDKHMEIVQCLVCHHDFRLFDRAAAAGEGTPCWECHKVKPSAVVPLGLREAYHRNCIGCHQVRLNWKQKTGPVTCGECHKRTE